jgi:biotin carboxylase
VTPSQTIGLPRLAVLHSDSSVPVFELVKAAQDLCRIVWVVGWSSDEPPLRVLSRFGDVVDLSGMDTDQALDHVVDVRPDGVVVFNDPPIRFAAEIAKRLGLPFHTPSTAQLLTDKIQQRAALDRAGVASPVFIAVPSPNPLGAVPLPAVLKPRVSAGGRDTFLIETADQFARALSKCPPNEELILEQWLPDRLHQSELAADVVSVESVVRDGVVDHIMVTGRFRYSPPFRDTGGFAPSDLDAGDRGAVEELATAAAAALGVRDGILHTEIKTTPDGPRVVEVNGRLGGPVSGLVTRLGGPSLTEWAMRLALGLDVGPLPAFNTGAVSFARFIVSPPTATRVTTIDGLREVRELEGVDEVRVNLNPGETIDLQRGYLSHVLQVNGTAPSHAELISLVSKIDSSLQLRFDYD